MLHFRTTLLALLLCGVAHAEPARPLTDFPEDYVREYSGHYGYAVPEAFELANILLVISDWGTADEQGNYFKDTPYFEAVNKHFGPFRNHPAVAAAQRAATASFNDFVGFRENSTRFHFEGDRLVASGFLDSWWSPDGLPDAFATHRQDIEDFARRSGFRAFYARHRPTYDAQIAEYREMIDLGSVASWLQAQFGVQYHTYRIYFSPLLRGNHSASMKSGNGYNWLAVVVASPRMARVRSIAGGDLLLLRFLFTEIDHGYADPVSMQHRAAIEQAWSRTEFWYEDPRNFYAAPFRAFNEYITWAAMLCYIGDHFPAIRYRLAREEIVRYMSRSRGFPQFGAFMDEVDRIRREHPGAPLSELYPALLTWGENHQRPD